jgi:hypothetical protein
MEKRASSNTKAEGMLWNSQASMRERTTVTPAPLPWAALQRELTAIQGEAAALKRENAELLAANTSLLSENTDLKREAKVWTV